MTDDDYFESDDEIGPLDENYSKRVCVFEGRMFVFVCSIVFRIALFETSAGFVRS